MAVNFGSNEIKVYLGNKEVTSIHFGEKEVYSSGPYWILLERDNGVLTRRSTIYANKTVNFVSNEKVRIGLNFDIDKDQVTLFRYTNAKGSDASTADVYVKPILGSGYVHKHLQGNCIWEVSMADRFVIVNQNTKDAPTKMNFDLILRYEGQEKTQTASFPVSSDPTIADLPPFTLNETVLCNLAFKEDDYYTLEATPLYTKDQRTSYIMTGTGIIDRDAAQEYAYTMNYVNFDLDAAKITLALTRESLWTYILKEGSSVLESSQRVQSHENIEYGSNSKGYFANFYVSYDRSGSIDVCGNPDAYYALDLPHYTLNVGESKTIDGTTKTLILSYPEAGKVSLEVKTK